MKTEASTLWFSAVFAAGFLTVPFAESDALREWLLGTGTPAAPASAAVLGVCLTAACWSLLRKGFAWADPAWLTWSDFDGARPRVLRGRLLRAWAARFGGVAYLGALAAILFGFPLPAVQIAVSAVAAGGSLAVVWPAVHAGRVELVKRFQERMVRRTSWAFLDPWALLPAGRAVAWRGVLTGRLPLARFVLAGMLARRRGLPVAAALVVLVALAHLLFPVVDPAWWLGLGAYGAALPFAGALSELTRSAGLRRWVAHGDRALRVTTVALLLMFLALWAGLAIALGVPITGGGAAALVVAAAAVVRTATRPVLDFANLGIISVAGILVPAGLVSQVLHGPDLLLLALVLLGAGFAAAVPISLALSAATTFRTGSLLTRPG